MVFAPESRNNLGSLLYFQGQHEAAKAQFGHALAIAEDSLGPEHPFLVSSLTNLGTVLNAQGRYEQAEAKLRSALTIAEEALGPDHVEAVTSRCTLSRVLFKRGKFDEAQAEYGRALAGAREALPPQHPIVGDLTSGLGEVLWKTNQISGAQEQFREALSICANSVCEAGVEARAKFGLARIVWKQGKDKQRGLELANQSRRGFANMAHLQTELRQVETWLKARGAKLEPIGEDAVEPKTPSPSPGSTQQSE